MVLLHIFIFIQPAEIISTNQVLMKSHNLALISFKVRLTTYCRLVQCICVVDTLFHSLIVLFTVYTLTRMRIELLHRNSGISTHHFPMILSLSGISCIFMIERSIYRMHHSLPIKVHIHQSRT